MDTLTWDQQYFVKMCQAVMSGHCSAEDAAAKPPPFHDARWLNEFSTILRLHLSTKAGPKRTSMLRMVNYIIKVYGPAWLLGKWNPAFKDGPHNFLRLTMLQRQHCSAAELLVVEKNLMVNFYWAHEENVLASLLMSEEVQDRKFAVDQIQRIRLTRNADQEDGGIRYFIKPSTLNLGATSIRELVDLDKATMEPPITLKLSTEELQQIVHEPYDFKDIPCHTQAVEAVIPLVTRMSRKVADRNLREGAVKNIKESRKSNPKIHHKGSLNL